MAAGEAYRRAEELFEKEKYAEALEWYRRAAEEGADDSVAAEIWLVYWYGSRISEGMKGMTRISDLEASKWCRDLAERGMIEAQFMMGEYLCNGEDMEHNPAEAVKWWKMAAEGGDYRAIYSLAWCYMFDDEGVERNDEKAIELYEAAVNYFLDNEDKTLLPSCRERERCLDAESIICLGCHELGWLYRKRENATYEDLHEAHRYLCLADEYGFICDDEIDEVEEELRNDRSHGGEIWLFIDELAELAPREAAKRVEEKLKGEFGEIWGTLFEESRGFLITGLYTLSALYSGGCGAHVKMDYSAAIVPMVKACEIEFGNVFFDGYLDFLEGTGVPPADFNSMQRFVETAEDGSPRYVDRRKTGIYTLGGFRCYAGIYRPDKSSADLVEIRDALGCGEAEKRYGPESDADDRPFEHMVDFMDKALREDSFPGPDRRERISEYLLTFADRTGRMARDVRNPASHSRMMSCDDAVYCANMVFMTERLLCEFMGKVRPEYLVKHENGHGRVAGKCDGA